MFIKKIEDEIDTVYTVIQISAMKSYYNKKKQ